MMNNVVTMYKVVAWGGICGETREDRWFTTVEQANENIKAETWCRIGGLYEVTFTPNENGRIEVVETTMKHPKTAREIEQEKREIEYTQKQIDRFTQLIAETEASKKRIRTETGMIKKEKEINRYKEMIAEKQTLLEKLEKRTGM